MKNSFLDTMKENTNYGLTENGAVKHMTTMNDVYDMFAMGGAFRNRPDSDCITLFKNALEENEELAMKCLFYLRDIRGGQGERRFFRVCYRWLCNIGSDIAKRNLKYIPEYGRWDDLIYIAVNTPLADDVVSLIKEQLNLDMDCKIPSLLGKWMPSENTSSRETKRIATKLRKSLEMTSKQYRKMLSSLRKKINIVERLMSENRWDEIEFDKIPSKAGLKYKNAFSRRDILKERYSEFAKDDTKVVNASTLYPYDIAHKAFHCYEEDYQSTDRLMIQKYWDNLKDFYKGRQENGLAIIDTSGSMSGTPIEVAVSMGAYIAERGHGPFANHFISFSSQPELIKFEGIDITDKLQRAERASWGFDTNLEAVFDLLLKTAKNEFTKQEDMPERLYIFSDMEFNGCIEGIGWKMEDAERRVETLVEGIARKWKVEGYELPHIIFWNLDARQNNIPALRGCFSYVSGFSPVMIDTILSGKDGIDLMLEKLNSDRYKDIV